MEDQTGIKAWLYEPVDIDAASIEALGEAGLFAFRVRLSGEPDLIWSRMFDHVWKECRAPGKLHAQVEGDGLRVVCSSSQDMADLLFLVESRIKAVNSRMQSYWRSQGRQAEMRHFEGYGKEYIPFAQI